MSYTIIKGMEIPEIQRIGFFHRGSKFDTVIADLEIGDCVKFDHRKEANYFCKVLKNKKMQGSTRKIDDFFYVWRII